MFERALRAAISSASQGRVPRPPLPSARRTATIAVRMMPNTGTSRNGVARYQRPRPSCLPRRAGLSQMTLRACPAAARTTSPAASRRSGTPARQQQPTAASTPAHRLNLGAPHRVSARAPAPPSPRRRERRAGFERGVQTQRPRTPIRHPAEDHAANCEAREERAERNRDGVDLDADHARQLLHP